MKFSQRKKSKMRKKRFEHNKREWSGSYWVDVDGMSVIDKISIGQTLYLLAEGIDTEEKFFYRIYRVGAKGELTPLSRKRILGKKGAFEKAKKWYLNTELVIDSEGEIIYAETPEKLFDLSGSGVVMILEVY